MPDDWYYFYKLHNIRRHELMGIANAMMNTPGSTGPRAPPWT